MNDARPRIALRWQRPLGILIALALILYFWKALLYLAVFSGAWLIVSLLALRAKQNKALSLVGGGAAALLAVLALSAVIRGSGEAVEPDTVSSAAPEAIPSRSERYLPHAAGTPVYFFRPLYALVRHSAFKYEVLPCGAVRFFNAGDHREYCLTQPFEMTERPLPESAVDEASPDAMLAREQAMNAKLKFYVITSYATPKGHHYTTYRYAVDRNGTVHFEEQGRRFAIPPPYIIQESFVAEGNHPKIPDYPSTPDRG